MKIDYYKITKIDYLREKDVFSVRFECYYNGELSLREGCDVDLKIKQGLSLEDRKALISKKITSLIVSRIEQSEMQVLRGEKIKFNPELLSKKNDISKKYS